MRERERSFIPKSSSFINTESETPKLGPVGALLLTR